MKKIIQETVTWLQEQVKESHTNGLVVGLSGGLDSAVVAHLIKKAFPDNSLAVIMPIKSSPTDIEHAHKVAEASQIKTEVLDLTESHQVLLKTIKNITHWNQVNEQLNDGNLRARLRMSTLYSVATNFNYLVVGTDNKAEWHTGYFTKFGDGGVDIQPIIDLTKSEVKAMAQELGVYQAIIEKEPSADLWEGQTDEEEMGTSYQMIDAYLNGEEIPEKDAQIIRQLHERSEHKRRIAPQFLFKK